MTTRSYVVATAGHVDHGKSALVKALTGTDPDRLREEKLRGMTIDLGFAHLKLTDPSKPDRLLSVGLVDVPGHEDFVKNMTVGVGSADAVVLVVAADDGWMPQTEEHVQILTYLGVRRAVIALTKIDLVRNEKELASRVKEHLQESPFEDAPIVPISVVTGRGLSSLKSTLTEILINAPTAKDFGKPRLFVDRVFVLRGVGTVVTGTLTGGSLVCGQQVVVQPHGQSTRIRAMESHNCSVQQSIPGNRTALNLPNVSARSLRHTEGIRRGDVVTARSLGEPSLTVNAILMRNPAGYGETARPLKSGIRIRIHHGTANSPARICFLERKELSPGEQLHAQVRLESPLYAFAGDRFVIRDWAQRATIAGGVILDTNVTRAGYRSQSERNFLSRRAQALDCADSWLLAQIIRDKVIKRQNALLMTRFSEREITGAINAAVNANKALLFGELIADKTWWAELVHRAMQLIEQRHEDHPEQNGLTLTELRESIPAAHFTHQLFDVLLSYLCKHGFTRQDSFVMRASYQPSLPRRLHRASEKLRSSLQMRPLDPPSKHELATDEDTREALRCLLQTGQVVEINDELVISVEAFASAKESVTSFLQRQGSASTSEIRRELGTSRRIAIPILEKLDRDGITFRRGQERVLRNHLVDR